MLEDHLAGYPNRSPNRISESDAKTESGQGLPRTYGRTDLRRRTHLASRSHVQNRAQGGSKILPIAEVNPAPAAAATRGLQAVPDA